MARKNPLGEAFDIDLEIPDTSKLDKGLRSPQVEPTAPNWRGGRPPLNAAQAANTYQGPPRPAGFATSPGYAPPPGADVGARAQPSGSAPVQEALAAEARSPWWRDPAGSLRGAGERVGQAGVAGAGKLATAGKIVGGSLLNPANPIIPAVAAMAPHGNAYFDDNVPFKDKARIGATDAIAGLTSAAGAVFGGGVGSAVLPVVGTAAGAIAGGTAGERLGRMAGNYMFEGNEALKRGGYNPDRTALNVASDLYNGKGADAFGVTNNPNYSNEGRPPTAIPDGPQSLADSAAYPEAGPTRQAYTNGGQSPNIVSVGNGKEFSGTDVRQGFRYSDGRKGGGTVSSLDTSAGAASDIRELARNAAERQAAAAAPMGGITGIEDPRGLRRRELDMAQKDSKNSGESTRGYNARIANAAQALREFDGAEDRRPAEMMRENTLRSANRLNNETARRGQDREVDERRIMAASAAASAARLQANADRAYQMDVAKFGVDIAEKNRSARAAEQTAVDKNLEGMFRTRDKDGKDVADTAKVGAYKTALETSIAELIKRHVATGRPENLKVAQQLQDRGLAALGPEDHAKMRNLFDFREQSMAGNGPLPGQASMRFSDNLFDYEQMMGPKGRDSRFFGGDRINTKAGNVSYNDLRYKGELANRFLPDVLKQESMDLTRNLR